MNDRAMNKKSVSKEEIESRIKNTMDIRAEKEYELSKKYSFFQTDRQGPMKPLSNKEIDEYIKLLGERHACMTLLDERSKTLEECKEYYDIASQRLLPCPEYFQGRECMKKARKLEKEYNEKCNKFHEKK